MTRLHTDIILSDGIGTSKGEGKGDVRGIDELERAGVEEELVGWSVELVGMTEPSNFVFTQSIASSSFISSGYVRASCSEFLLRTRASITSNASARQPLCFSKHAKNGSSHIGNE